MFSAKQLVEIAARAGVDVETAEHFAPLLALLAAVQPPPVVPPSTLAAAGFDLWRAYSAEEAADILGIKRSNTLYEIPEVELPRVRVGPTRTAVRFVGIDLLCYMRKLQPIDWGQVRSRAQEVLAIQAGQSTASPPTVRALFNAREPVRVQ